MLEKARSEKPLPVIVISSPPLVQPELGEIVTWIGLEYFLSSPESSRMDLCVINGDKITLSIIAANRQEINTGDLTNFCIKPSKRFHELIIW